MGSLLDLYKDHVLGDGHGFSPPNTRTAVVQGSVASDIAPESTIQAQKRMRHIDRQVREIAAKIAEFRQLGDCDHD